MSKDFNLSHPEKKDIETYLTNTTMELFGKTVFWYSARQGKQAFTQSGEKVDKRSGLLPVFVKTEELLKAGRVPKDDGDLDKNPDEAEKILTAWQKKCGRQHNLTCP